ncbi:hypothetical protein AAG906_035939 [Vitis piasezkii]
MGFDSGRLVVSSSKFSVSSKKQKYWSNNIVGNATAVPHSLKPIAGNGQEKISISGFRDSRTSNSGNLKYQNSGKDFGGLTRHPNVNTRKDVKGNDISSPTPSPFPSSPCDSRKRLFHLPSISSHEGSPKSARIDCSKTPVSLGGGNVPNDNFCNTHTGFPTPKSPNTRSILSFGNIYKASKNKVLQNDPHHTKYVQVNGVPGIEGKMGLGAPEPSQSSKNVLGFGGCNYGHGSIMKGVKNVENLSNVCEVTRSKALAEKPNCRVVPHFESVEKLKNAGNQEYRRGRYMEAISFYDKAIALNCQNAACHNNKAAALAGLGKFTEAVGECLQAINCDPSYSRAHYRLGTLYTRLGRVNEAKWHVKLSGHDLGSEAMQRLLHLEVHLTNMQKARKVQDWDHVLKESTLSIEAGADASNQVLAAKAEALLKLHRAKEALELLMDAKNSEESKSRKAGEEAQCLLIIETQINLYLGRFEEGVLAAEQAVNLHSSSKSLMWLRKARGVADARKAGNEFYKTGKYLEACSLYGQGLQHDPTNCVLLCNRAACRSKLGQWETAIDDCNAALRNRPDYSKALLRRAYSNVRLERWEESLRDYSVLSKEMPGDHVIADALLQVQMELKKAKGAGAYNIELWPLRS